MRVGIFIILAGGAVIVGAISYLAWSAVHSEDIYKELRQWQAGIGAFVGLCALLAGALFNAHLTRRRDERLRKFEGEAAASAIAGAFETMADVFDNIQLIAEAKLKSGPPYSLELFGRIQFDVPDLDAITGQRRYLLGAFLNRQAGNVIVGYSNFKIGLAKFSDEATEQTTKEMLEGFISQVSQYATFARNAVIIFSDPANLTRPLKEAESK